MNVFRLNVSTDGKINLQLLVLLVQLTTDNVSIDCIDNEILQFIQPWLFFNQSQGLAIHDHRKHMICTLKNLQKLVKTLKADTKV